MGGGISQFGEPSFTFVRFPGGLVLGFGTFTTTAWVRFLVWEVFWGIPGGSVVKNSPASAGATEDIGSTLQSGRSPGEGNGSPLQYSCLGNPMNRGAWQATLHEVAKSQTQFRLNNSIHILGPEITDGYDISYLLIQQEIFSLHVGKSISYSIYFHEAPVPSA